MSTKQDIQRVFISYSWSTPEYEARVIELATNLVQSGVDVLLDKWDLREGGDINTYMEKIVTDSSITKVLILCDRAYMEKANGRIGGVGTETLIVTPDIYSKNSLAGCQNRYIPIVMERDEEEKACLPVYLAGRYYIDMSSSEAWENSFEQLLRVIYDKPRYKKPELGGTPAFLHADNGISLATSTRQRSVINAIHDGRLHAKNLCQDYFDSVVTNLERFRINTIQTSELDDEIVSSIAQLEVPRNEIVDVIEAMIRYLDQVECGECLHSFFEKLYPYTQWPDGQQGWIEASADNFRFFIHEIFLYAIAICLKEKKYIAIPIILMDYYFVNRFRSRDDDMLSYVELRPYLKSLELRNKRLKTRRLSLHSDMLSERAGRRIGVTFHHVMQADFFLFIHSNIHKDGQSRYPYWWPITLLYADRINSFEVFSRCQSLKQFDQLKVALEIDDVGRLKQLCDEFNMGKRNIPRWEFESFAPGKLMCIDKLATKP